MGAELTTDGGPVSLVWADTFFPYGLEVRLAPLPEQYPHLDADRFVAWRVGDHPLWRPRLGSPVRAATAAWDHRTLGPAVVDGVVVGVAYDVDVPSALRLDFDAGPVWVLAAIPRLPDAASVFGGDELMVVFSRDRMRRIGIGDDAFLA